MANFSLRVGAIFELEGAAYQIERLHSTGPQEVRQVVLQRCHDGHTVLKTDVELLSAYTAGRITALDQSTVAAPTAPVSLPLSGLKEPEMREFKRRRAYVLALVDCVLNQALMAVAAGRMALPLWPGSADVDQQAMRVESCASRQVRRQRLSRVHESGAGVTNGAVCCDNAVPNDIALGRALQADVQLGCRFKRH